MLNHNKVNDNTFFTKQKKCKINILIYAFLSTIFSIMCMYATYQYVGVVYTKNVLNEKEKFVEQKTSGILLFQQKLVQKENILKEKEIDLNKTQYELKEQNETIFNISNVIRSQLDQIEQEAKKIKRRKNKIKEMLEEKKDEADFEQLLQRINDEDQLDRLKEENERLKMELQFQKERRIKEIQTVKQIFKKQKLSLPIFFLLNEEKQEKKISTENNSIIKSDSHSYTYTNTFTNDTSK